MTETAVQGPSDLEIQKSHLEEKLSGNIFLLPVETSSAVVQLSPELQITCLIPATTRNLTAKYHKYSSEAAPFELKTPDLIWKFKICDIDPYKLSPIKHGASESCPCTPCKLQFPKMPAHRYTIASLHAVDMVTANNKQLLGSPYRIANVHGVGTICWGSIDYPNSPKEAHLKFFGATLNNSTNDYYLSGTTEYIQALQRYVPAPPSNMYSVVFGKKYLATSEKTMGIFVSSHEHLTSEFSDATPFAGSNVVVGFANRDPSNAVWHVDFESQKKWFTENQVIIR